MLCQLQVYRKLNHIYIYKHIYLYISILLQILFSYRLLQNMDTRAVLYLILITHNFVFNYNSSDIRIISFKVLLYTHEWQPTPVFLPGESQGWGSLVGCHLWGRTESDTTEVTQQYIPMNKASGHDGIPAELFKILKKMLLKCSPMDYIPHGILQARILAQVAFPFSRASS